MAFVLNSRIKIGRYSWNGVNEISIKKNVHVIVDTATVKMPGKANVLSAAAIADTALSIIGFKQTQIGQLPSSIQTASLFKEGDPVSIDLGYNGDLRNEFRGFVRRVNQTTPVSIELEGYAWQLRNQNILASWKTTTVKEVLQRIIQGTDIVLSPDIPVIPLTNYHTHNHSGLEVLDDMKHRMLLTVYFIDNMLYVGLEEGRSTTNSDGTTSLTGMAEVKYNIGYNCVVNQPDLKRRLGKDNLVRVRLTVREKNGKQTLYEAGDQNGAVHSVNMPYLRDKSNLQALVAARLKRLKYDGYEGKLQGFLQPFCQPGWKATIIDKGYDNARAGTYFVFGTDVTFGVKGARRGVEIGYRLDAPTTSN